MIVVYFLAEENGRKTYIGYTTNLKRRIRQHRGEIKGGARYTSRWSGNVRIRGYVGPFPTKSLAMSYEKYAQRKRGKKRWDEFFNPTFRNLSLKFFQGPFENVVEQIQNE